MRPHDIDVGGVLSDIFFQAAEALINEWEEAASHDFLGRDGASCPASQRNMTAADT